MMNVLLLKSVLTKVIANLKLQKKLTKVLLQFLEKLEKIEFINHVRFLMKIHLIAFI